MRRYLVISFALGCASWPATRMEPVESYAASERPTVSSAPAFAAGPSDHRTYSPDGATLFVCKDGRTRNAAHVTPGATPAC